MEALQRLHNRGSISTGYDVDNSCKFDQGNNTTTVEFFERNVSSAGSRTIGTFSAWIKKTDVSTAQYLFTFGNVDNDTGRTFARFQADQTLRIGGGTSVWRNTNRVFRDPSAWYHIVIAFDTTQSTANDRFKLYVNGVQETSFSTTNNPSQNDNLGLNFGKQAIGYNTVDNTAGFNGYMCEVVIQDGVASAPTEFGEFDEDSGIWIPKDASDATMGTNGSYLKFENAANMGAATAGNNFTVQNINQNDQSTDTCTNNFATINALHAYSGTASHNPSFTHGNTRFTTERAGYWANSISSIGVTSGKWYFEAQPGTSTTHITSIGYGDESDIHDWGSNIADTNGFPGETGTNSIGYQGSDGSGYGNVALGTGSTSNVNANYTISNVVGVAIDADNGYVYFAKDNTYVNSGNPGSGSSGTGGYTFEDTTTTRTGTVFPSIGGYYHTNACVINVNFGGYTTISISSAATDANGYGTFEYAPPSGYYALCTKNLEEYG